MTTKMKRGTLVLSAMAGIVTLIAAGCQTAGPDVRAAAGASTAPATSPLKAEPVAKAEKGGAELWSETCSHCHNLRSPATYGPAQWEIAVYDMRVRAHLTGAEQRKILEFLKAASQ